MGRPKTGGRNFAAGNPGKPKGVLNKATREIKEAARALLENPAYLEMLAVRLQNGTAGPIESLLYHYAYGKPKEAVEMSGPEGSAIKVVFGGRYKPPDA